MSREPSSKLEEVDKDLLFKIKEKIKEGKGPNKIKKEIDNVSLNTIRRYFRKIRQKIW